MTSITFVYELNLLLVRWIQREAVCHGHGHRLLSVLLQLQVAVSRQAAFVVRSGGRLAARARQRSCRGSTCVIGVSEDVGDLRVCGDERVALPCIRLGDLDRLEDGLLHHVGVWHELCV